jgi:DNA-directed RNA polymerase specialized sigma24 family protein
MNAQIWTEHFEAVCKNAMYGSSDAEAVRDSAVEVFRRLDAGEIVFDPARGSLRNFLTIATRNLARDRKPHRLLCASDMSQAYEGDNETEEMDSAFDRLINGVATNETPEDVVSARQTIEAIEKRLDERSFAVLWLRITGHNSAEIQKALGLTYEQVHKSLTHARQVARSVLEESGE